MTPSMLLNAAIIVILLQSQMSTMNYFYIAERYVTARLVSSWNICHGREVRFGCVLVE
jgi:hypothetical protein